jgi:hypothetical protein
MPLRRLRVKRQPNNAPEAAATTLLLYCFTVSQSQMKLSSRKIPGLEVDGRVLRPVNTNVSVAAVDECQQHDCYQALEARRARLNRAFRHKHMLPMPTWGHQRSDSLC